MIGGPTSAAARTYSGFTAKDFSQATIAANGSTVVNIYYDRVSYKITYEITGDHFPDVSYAEQNYVFGAAVTPEADPIQIGYSFSGWLGVPETMPANNVTATGSFTPAQVGYKVEHYIQNLGSSEYSLKDTDNLSGTAGGTTAAVAKDYLGFTAQNFSQATIAANGSTIVRIDYNRNDYTITYKIVGSYFTNASYDSKTYQFEQNIVPLSKPTQTGYTFIGWTGEPETMPARDIEVTGYFTPGTGTAYKVEHHLQDLGVATYSLKETDDMVGVTGQQTTAEANSYSGFSVKEFSQATISADGDTIVKIYYDRDSYTITYKIVGSYFTNASYAVETYEFEEVVVPKAAPSQTGYTFIGWTGEPETMPEIGRASWWVTVLM